ncbi:hypothetical protein ACOSQ3_003097 [Xanthoceras sorbifolium]
MVIGPSWVYFYRSGFAEGRLPFDCSNAINPAPKLEGKWMLGLLRSIFTTWGLLRDVFPFDRSKIINPALKLEGKWMLSLLGFILTTGICLGTFAL